MFLEVATAPSGLEQYRKVGERKDGDPVGLVRSASEPDGDEDQGKDDRYQRLLHFDTLSG